MGQSPPWKRTRSARRDPSPKMRGRKRERGHRQESPWPAAGPQWSGQWTPGRQRVGRDAPARGIFLPHIAKEERTGKETAMPKRSEKRDAARAAYVEKKSRGGKVNLRELAEELGVSYQTVRNWKAADGWDQALPPKKRGGQPGNRNSAGHKNAAGSHKGAPAGNRNAEKDGAYSTVFFDMLTPEEREILHGAPVQGREALEHEMKILKFREHKILAKISEYERAPEDALYLNSVTDMREPAGRGKDRKDGAAQQMGMYNKDSAFARVLKLQEALYKVQGRIAKIADSLRAMEENKERLALERERLEIMRIRATGRVEIGGDELEPEGEADMPELEGGGDIL